MSLGHSQKDGFSMQGFHEKTALFLPLEVKKIALYLQEKGHQAYVVGGGVRDSLLKRRVLDWDLCTSAPPQEVMVLFKRVIPTGLKHGTVTVLTSNQQGVEVTTLRKEGAYKDHRHPDQVVYTQDLKEDLARRDFTINAMAWDPKSKILYDHFEGQKNLKEKIIKTVGNAKDRFEEDGLRSLRAIRFAAELNFSLDQEIMEAIPKTLESTQKVAPERIKEELMKMLGSPKPSIGLELLRKTKLMEWILPELLEGYGMEQNKFHAFDVYHHSLKACDEADPLPLLRLAVLLHDIAKPRTRKMLRGSYRFYGHDRLGAKMAKKIMGRLRFSNNDQDYVINLVRNHMFYYQDEWSDSAVRRFIKRVGEKNLEDLLHLRVADEKASGVNPPDYERLKVLRDHIEKIRQEESALSVKQLAISGKEVMKILGIKPGPKVGKILNELLEKVLDDPQLNEPDKLQKIVQTYKEPTLPSRS